MVLQNTGKFTKSRYENQQEASARRLEDAKTQEELDEKYGYEKLNLPCEKLGWLINLCAADILNEDKRLISALDLYFLQDDGKRFKISVPYKPYFYVAVTKDSEREMTAYLQKKFMKIHKIEIQKKEDLDLHNHLIGIQRTYIKLIFFHVDDMLSVRQVINSAVRKNKEKGKSAYSSMLSSAFVSEKNTNKPGYKVTGTQDQMENIVDIREYDVPYHVRVSIDLKIFVGVWYTVQYLGSGSIPVISRRDDILVRPDPVVLAYDIETTKLPLKFPDSETDNIIMISYMIDGVGYLICNREIVSADVEDFEFTPRPEFVGKFEVFNEEDELATLNRFFDHILDVKPHIIVTYNGDFFDWPFVEARALKHGINMTHVIGFCKDSQGEYKSRQSSHMDAYRWVKRDSYLPVGSQNLKAAAKAKLRYDPVELDPEDMCRLASEQPQILANYSVSDAVATYYLYMKYVHPFIFALCTIIPMEPDSVLRKGSGTLCEALLMVQAFHANIIYPNKQETVFNKMTNDGHILDSETYVGGHVEALECGVFRSNIPCNFRGDPEMYMKLHDEVERTIKFCIEVEEKVPLHQVQNFQEVCNDIKEKLKALHDKPVRLENPFIYHLDVGAMYPNIILTNRLQPSAMVDEVICAACDFNKPGATCQRSMSWMWRGEFMPASRSEFYRIQQQLENERFPNPNIPSEHLSYHELSKEEQANQEKKRLQEYCRKAYKKIKVKRFEERYTTVCQRENSFYVDTVRMFRDRRYEFKAALKRAKKQVSEATASNDAAEIKKARGLEVLFDSLQLAHKCILNSFYGYVMRRGARWYSMEMAGIVCYTGAKIIQDARKIVDKIGRPLELDTDGIWCVLPCSFPENYTILSNNPKKPKLTISYPGAMLNIMVKDNFTNDQYEELVDPVNLNYELRSENSIFFEVDGPYLAMVLPAAKEEGKSLKKRYAVFNMDESLAELKGFEVKRRGELQLIKIFQSSVFDAFLKGKTLQEVYASVAKVADYWLDVLYSKAGNMPDSELFQLISENRSMSKKLEEYGSLKSTSISTAKRLAEFLGDQMVKDAGLACRFIISKKPDGAPVTERAIPLAIFQSESSIKRHYLRKWTRQSNMTNFDIRAILDWNYYIERLGSAIQKIITIPAALQGIPNPIPRVKHPDWLHKKLLEKNDVFKQKRITDMFTAAPKKRKYDDENVPPESEEINDMESFAENSVSENFQSKVTSAKRHKPNDQPEDENKNWREVLGSPPPLSELFQGSRDSRKSWIEFHKKKWQIQRRQKDNKQERNSVNPRIPATTGLGGFLKQQSSNIFTSAWEVIQIAETNEPGRFRVFALIGSEMHTLKVDVPRIFYVNQRTAKIQSSDDAPWKKVNRILPRSAHAVNLYEYRIPETEYLKNLCKIRTELANPDILAVYELQVPLILRLITELGCIWKVSRMANRLAASLDPTKFNINQLEFRSLIEFPYLQKGKLKEIYIYHHCRNNKHIVGVFISATNKCMVYVVDRARENRMPNLQTLYRAERENVLQNDEIGEKNIPSVEYTFEIRVETETNKMFKNLQRLLTAYKNERRGPTSIALQSNTETLFLSELPVAHDFPIIPIYNKASPEFIDELSWQKDAAKEMLQHFLESKTVVSHLIDQARYFHISIGNLPSEINMLGDLFFARHLHKHNHLLWCSKSHRPDLGGQEVDDNRLGMENNDNLSIELSNSGFYQSVCIELELSSLAVNTIVQAHHVNDLEGAAGSGVSFDVIQHSSLQDLISGKHNAVSGLANYDDTALCSNTFRILKSMIQGWLRDVSLHQNYLADHQLQNFYKWLSDPQSLFYDPAMFRTLHSMMKKLFLQLIAELKRMGSNIVFANFSKIIISTKKRNVEDALSYAEYINTSIISKDIFHSIVLNVSQSWLHLLWLDQSNFGGIKATEPNKENDSENSTQDSADSNKSVVEMNFNLCRYLPSESRIQSNFEMVVAGYISMIYHEFVLDHEALSQGVPVRRHTATQMNASITGLSREEREKLIVPSDGNVTTDLVIFAQDLIAGDLTEQMFSASQKMIKSLPSDASALAKLFPVLPGSHLKSLKNPVLEFVKCVCKVLEVDKHVSVQVEKMRLNLLRLVGVGEFSNTADWVDPCSSYVMGQLSCKNCNTSRDVDLCRDAISIDGDNLCTWICSGCSYPYDAEYIESRLIASIQHKVMAYNLQDLTCTKCNEVKQCNMAQQCECAGRFKTTVDSSDLEVTLKAFENIAKLANFKNLQNNLDWVFQTL